MKLIIVIILSFFFYSSSVVSQHFVKIIELPMQSIVDTNLNFILDSVVNFEKRCDYYNDSLFFTIKLKQIKKDSLYSLTIQSNNNMRTAINLAPDGYLYYKEHLFITYGFNSSLYISKTNKKRKFRYMEYDTNFNKENFVTEIDILNDSFTIWNYWYIKNKIIFKDRSGSCN